MANTILGKIDSFWNSYLGVIDTRKFFHYKHAFLLIVINEVHFCDLVFLTMIMFH